MATNYTSLLGFALPTTGELSGTWGDTVNNSITQLVEDSIAGTATQSVASGDWTLTTTGSGVANQARAAILIPTGTPGVSRNIIAPSKSKAYIVVNESDAAVVVKGSATTGVTIAAGKKAVVSWDGSDFVKVASNENIDLSSGVTGTLPVANGGTGQTSYTDGQLLIGNTSGNTLTKATLTAGTGITITNGAGSISIAATNTGTVTSVTGVSPIASSGGATPAISLSANYGDTQNPYASKTANYFLAAPDGTPGVPSFRAIVAADIPTLNQNTTGTAGNVSGVVAVANGGTGQTSLTANNIILGNGTSAVQFVAPGTTGNVLTSDGTTWVSQAAPSGMVYPGAGVAISTGTAWDTSKTNPAGAFVGTTDAQTLTNKTITYADNTLTGVVGTSATQTLTNKTITYADNTLTGVVGTTATQTLSNKTITNLVFDGSYTEDIYTVGDGASVDLNPADGTIQLWTLGANRTPTATNFATGQSMTLMINDGTAYTVTWTTAGVVWVGGTAPTLATTGYTVIELWKVASTLYGALVGSVA